MYYVVRALSPYTEYEFIVTAVNNIGRGSPSIAATCTTGETGKHLPFWGVALPAHRVCFECFDGADS